MTLTHMQQRLNRLIDEKKRSLSVSEVFELFSPALEFLEDTQWTLSPVEQAMVLDQITRMVSLATRMYCSGSGIGEKARKADRALDDLRDSLL